MMSFQFRHATCNEAFKDHDFRDACRIIRAAGYQGIEIAPFTLAEDPATVTREQRSEFRRIIEDEGLTFVGLHWLMVSPKGLHVTSPDLPLRQRSWKHIHDLIDLCADLGPDGVMVFGSPFQRCTTGGMSREEATKVFADGFAAAAPHAADRGVTLLMEALPIEQCDVVQSLDEAALLVRQIGHPAVQTMFDVHNAINETEPHDKLVERHFPLIRHVHVQELDGKHCGQGDYDFKPLLATLRRLNYQGWVSLEAFDFSYGAEAIVRESIEHLNREISQLPPQ